jgi:protein phosphatase
MWLKGMLRRILGGDGRARDPDETDEYPAPSSMMLIPGLSKLRVGVVSEVGNYREHNEDNYYIPGRSATRLDRPGESGGATATLLDLSQEEPFIVADGMGGQMAGEQASAMAVEIIPKAVARRLSPDQDDPKGVQRAIRDAVAEANQEILSSGSVTEFSNMGTTVVLALFHDERVYIAGIGDSRAYRLRDGRIEQLTKDHSLADALLDAGTISMEELPNHKFKNVLYLYLGCKDARGGPEEVRVLDVRVGDRFLLNTDGLTGVVRDDELARVLATCDDPQRAAQTLVTKALDNHSKDNVTCLVIYVI